MGVRWRTPASNRRVPWSSCSVGLKGDGRGRQSDDADQVVRGRDEIARQAGPRQAAEARAAEATDGFHPAEDLFDPCTLALTDAIASMPCRTSIDGAPSPSGVLGHVRGHVARTQVD